MKLDIKAFALALGFWWAAIIFLTTWWMILVVDGTNSMTFFEKLYPGYSVSLMGSIIGLVWAFFCGAINGAIIAWLYNFFVPHKP